MKLLLQLTLISVFTLSGYSVIHAENIYEVSKHYQRSSNYYTSDYYSPSPLAPAPYSTQYAGPQAMPRGTTPGAVFSNYGYGYGSFQQSPSSAYSPQAPVNISQPEPPPGTIGRSFKLPSRPVPVEKHPRVGMVDVKISNAKEVIVHDMNAMRTEDTIDGFRDAKNTNIWHFESKPLYPGLDHIYRIQATVEKEDGSEEKIERYIRLIMGRVVEIKI